VPDTPAKANEECSSKSRIPVLYWNGESTMKCIVMLLVQSQKIYEDSGSLNGVRSSQIVREPR
jgi:hypothetical protein